MIVILKMTSALGGGGGTQKADERWLHDCDSDKGGEKKNQKMLQTSFTLGPKRILLR